MKILPQWWRANFLQVEFVLALLLTTLFIVWAEFLSGYVLLENILKDNRSEIYSALAAIFGSLLGFAITAVSIVLGYSANERLTIVRESKYYPVLWRVFTSTIKVLGLATVVALMALILDRDSNPSRFLLYTNVFASLLASFRLARCIWILENIIKIVSVPTKTK